VKSIIVYTREQKAQNLYPRRIISPPAPNKCCPTRMEVLGRPRLDEQGRRFCYKRCRVCGFALRHFLDPVGTVLAPPSADARARRASLPIKGRPVAAPPPVVPPKPAVPPALPAPRVRPVGPPALARKPPPSRHGPRTVAARPGHAAEARPKSTGRRRR
jgi:hypothetical protein